MREALKKKVGAGGLEPPTPASQTRCATGLRYAPSELSIMRTSHNRQGDSCALLN